MCLAWLFVVWTSDGPNMSIPSTFDRFLTGLIGSFSTLCMGTWFMYSSCTAVTDLLPNDSGLPCCAQVFERLISDWCGDAGGAVAATPAGTAPVAAAPPVAETVPGFRRFAMEHLGEQACIVGVLRGGLDIRDAGTMALLGEVSSALKLVYRQCGEEFPTHLVSSVLPALGVPPAVQQQLVHALRTATVKELRECLKEAVVLLQGGSEGSRGRK